MSDIDALKNSTIILVERHSDTDIAIETDKGYCLTIRCSGRGEPYLQFSGSLEALLLQRIRDIHTDDAGFIIFTEENEFSFSPRGDEVWISYSLED